MKKKGSLNEMTSLKYMVKFEEGRIGENKLREREKQVG